METTDYPPPSIQNRSAFRTSLRPSEIEINRFWIHDPNVRFSGVPLSPEQHVLLLEEGVSLVNISAGGALIRVTTPPEIPIVRLTTLPAPPGDTGSRSKPDLRDVSMVMRIDQSRELRQIVITSKIVRITMIRTSPKATLFELAINFYAWGNMSMSGPVTQLRRVRDGNVPPVASWITRHQFSRMR